MARQVNSVFSGNTVQKGVSKALRNRLAVTTILAVAPFLGYGRQAHADCLEGPPGSFVCSGITTATQNINTNDAIVTTAEDFELTAPAGNGINITAAGHLQFSDQNESPISATNGTGLFVRSTGNSAANAGAITIDTNGNISGSTFGIYADNLGSGSIDITVDGQATGTTRDGIYARNSAAGEDLTITTGEESVVSGGDEGIDGVNLGNGDLTITANGQVDGANDGILAFNASTAQNLKVTTGTQSAVSAGDSGIYADNQGNGYLSVIANGEIDAQGGDGIYARNAGTNLSITSGVGSSITGTDEGIDGVNLGSGDLEIIANGSVTGANDGILAFNSNDGLDLTVTTGDQSNITGGNNGIDARNYSLGSSEITAKGQVTGQGGHGIYAYNYGQNLTVTTEANSAIVGHYDGIRAYNTGFGNLEITADGVVTGQDGDGVGGYGHGIYAVNSYYGINLTIETGANSAVTGYYTGIEAYNYGAGNLEITTEGAVTGQNGDGIFAYNSNYGINLEVTAESGSVVTAFGDGIDGRNYGSGNLEITANGEVTGTYGAGIRAYNYANGNTTIEVGTAGLAQGGYSGIRAYSDDGQGISITNDGTVRNLSAESDDLAITTYGGATDIENNGDLIGFVTLDQTNVYNDTLENNGFWNPANGTSDFGDGDDEVTNAGTLLAADDPTDSEVTLLSSLETFNNSGLVSLVDGQEGDILSIGAIGGAQYTGDNGRLAVDAVLGPPPDDPMLNLSDQLIIDGSTSGTTLVSVNVVDATGANLDGIPVVVADDGTTAEEHFDLDGGPFNAGFFTWDLRLDDGGGSFHELFTSGIGVGAYEFAAGIGGAQEVWHQTTGTLLQRQADLRALVGGTAVTPVADFAEPVEPTPTANITPGVWFKGVGAWLDRDEEEDGFVLDRKQTIWGGMAGFDFGTEGAGDVWMFGLFGGYLTSDLEFDETNTEWTYEGPTVGAYVTYLDHAFYADLTVKADFLDIEIDPGDLAPAADEEDTDAVNIGGRLDTGYKFGETLFIEPQASLALLHTEIDDVEIFGGNVEFDDETSIRGRLGLRLGFDQPGSDGTVYSGDVIASAWEEFAGDNDVTITDPVFGSFGASDDVGGTYGDVSVGFSVAAPEGWSGFIRGNYLFGEDYEAISGNAGLRYAF